MALFDAVPRDLYNDLQKRYDDLMKLYHALKLAGAVPTPEPRPGRVVSAGPTPDEKAHRRFIEDLANQMEQIPGIDPKVAKAEAERIRREAFGAEGGT